MDVLVVDDDNDLREMVVLVLEDEGFAVAGLHDHRSAVDRAGRDRPALVLLDLSMPGLMPEVVVEGLRRLSPSPAVVALSGRCDAEELAHLLRLEGLLLKPFPMEALVEVARRHCRRPARVESGPRPATPAL
jgi:DNA-binding response OmpR family regulator